MHITKSIQNIVKKSNTFVKNAMKKGVRSLKGGYINTVKKHKLPTKTSSRPSRQTRKTKQYSKKSTK